MSSVTVNMGPCPGIMKFAMFITWDLIRDWVFCNSVVPNSCQIVGSNISSSFSNKSPIKCKNIEI